MSLELYTLILRALQDGPCKESASALAKEMEPLLPQRYDYLGQKHKITLEEHLKLYPHINGQTLLNICEKLKAKLEKEIPPSVIETSLLGDGHQNLLRSRETLYSESVRHAANSLLASRHYLSPAYTNHSINLCKSMRARRVKGTIGLQKTIPTEFYNRITRFKRVLCHLSPVYCVAFDRTGKFLFTGADDSLIKVWSATNGRLLATLRGHSGEITDISINYENRLLASGSVDRLIRVWDLRSTKMIECLSSHTAIITSVKFSPYNRQGNERWLASTSNDGCINFWKYDANTLNFERRPIKLNERIKPGGQMVCSSISMGGSFLACGSSDFFVRVYGWHHSIKSPYRELEIEKHSDQVDSLQFCNKGYRFVSGSKDGCAIIWYYSAREWKHIRLEAAAPEEKVKVSMVGWSLNDAYVITSLSDNSIKVWNSYTGKLVHTLKEHTEEAYLIENHPTDPRIFLSAGHDGRIILWDIEKGISINSFQNTIDGQGHASIYDCKFSPDGQMFAATDSHGHLSLYGFGSAEPYSDLPDQIFFHSDYRPLIRDVHGFVMDEQTHLVPHLMPRPQLVDMNGDPHEDRYQRLVPTYVENTIRVRDVIPPMSDQELKSHSALIEAHGIAESETHLAELNKERHNRGPFDYPIPVRNTRERAAAANREEPRHSQRRPSRQNTARVPALRPPPRQVPDEVYHESSDSSSDTSSSDSDYVQPTRRSLRRSGRHRVPSRRTNRSRQPDEPGPSNYQEEQDDEETEQDDDATEVDDEATDIEEMEHVEERKWNRTTQIRRSTRIRQRKRKASSSGDSDSRPYRRRRKRHARRKNSYD